MYTAGTRAGVIEAGFKVRDAQKSQRDTELFYSFNGTADMSQFLGTFTNPNYYFGDYKIGPTTDWNKVLAFFNGNRNLFAHEVAREHRTADPNDFNTSERVYAGYVMNTITLGRVRLQGGLRFESTRASFIGTQVNFDPSGEFLSDTLVPGQQSYTDVLPSVQFQYSLGGNMNFRAAYGRGIARPNFSDLPPYATIDQAGLGGLTKVKTGNQNLRPTHAHNFDLLFEKYLKTVGIIQAGWFYKALSDPIFAVGSVTHDRAICRGPGDSADQRSERASHRYRNGLAAAFDLSSRSAEWVWVCRPTTAIRPPESTFQWASAGPITLRFSGKPPITGTLTPPTTKVRFPRAWDLRITTPTSSSISFRTASIQRDPLETSTFTRTHKWTLR